MKMSIFSMLFVLVLLAIAPIVYFNGGFSDMGFNAPAPKKEIQYNSVSTDKDVTVYKWKDANGVWQYGSMPPAGQANVESMDLRRDTNVMKAIPLEDEKVAEKKGGKVVSMGISKDALENPYKPENVKELMDNTMNIQDMLDSRAENQKNILNNIGHK